MFTKFIACLSAFFHLACLTAQVNVAVVFDRQPVETGDTFTMRVLVSGTNAKPDRVDFSPWANFVSSENVLHRSNWSSSAGRWLSEYTLIVFDPLDAELPPLAVMALSGERILSNPVNLTVRATAAPEDIASMEPLRPLWHEPYLWTDFALLLALAGMVYGIYRLLSRRRPKTIAHVPQVPAPLPVEEAEPAHQIALQRLNRLTQNKPWETGDIKGYYAVLSHILKEYLEKGFNISALESTTAELEILLYNTPFSDSQKTNLVAILNQTDLAKYAQALDPAHPHEQYLLKAAHFVKKTAEPNS